MNLLNLFDVLPNPKNARFIYAAVVLTVVGTILIVGKSGDVNWWLGIAALAATSLVLVGLSRTKRSEVGDGQESRRSYRFVWFSGGLLLSLGGLLWRGNASPAEWLLVAAPFFLAALYDVLQTANQAAAVWLFPLVLSSCIVGVSALMGNVTASIFPGVLGLFLGLILQALRDLERRVTTSAIEDAAAQKLVQRRLSWVSVVVFVFGVISLWPWLGKLYGLTYLWILIVGVLIPIMTLWGRLRQPRHDNLLTALKRFNRVLPYASLILLLAFIVG